MKYLLRHLARFAIVGTVALSPLAAKIAKPDTVVIEKFGAPRVIAQEPETAEQIKHRFVQVLETTQLPPEEQEKRIAELYGDFWKMKDNGISFGSILYLHLNIPDDIARLSPTAQADALYKKGGSSWLRDATKTADGKLLLEHRDKTGSLIKSDFRSGDLLRTERALNTLIQLGDSWNPSLDLGSRSSLKRVWLRSFYSDVLRVFKRGDKLSQTAVRALRNVDDPRAIRVLVERTNKLGDNLDVIHDLAAKRSANRSLLHLLESSDPQMRDAAIYCLMDSGDPVLVPYVRRLVKDSSARIRMLATKMGFQLDEDGFQRVSASLQGALHDPDIYVRASAAEGFALRKDKIVAQSLLSLVRDAALEQSELGTTSRSQDFSAACSVVRSIQELAGHDFFFDTSNNSWHPNSEANLSARNRYTTWIEDNTLSDKASKMEIYLLDQSQEPRVDIKTANTAMLANEPHSLLMSMNDTKKRTQLLVGAEEFKPDITWGKTSQGQPVVFFELRDKVKDRVAQLTAEVANQNRYLVIFVDDVYVCDFLVQKAWTDGQGKILGSFQDMEQAEVMANRLRAGLEMHA